MIANGTSELGFSLGLGSGLSLSLLSGLNVWPELGLSLGLGSVVNL